MSHSSTSTSTQADAWRADEFDLIVFDWDGTVVDSIEVIASSIQKSAADLGLAVPTSGQARHVIGLGLHEALQLAVPDLTQARVPEFTARYRHHFLAAADVDSPFAGIAELLRALRAAGRMLAVATGKSRRGLDRALEQTGFGPLFHATRCADEGRAKPHPWMLEDLSDTLCVPRHRIVMIGDTTHDIEMARAFGTACIGVLYGAHDRLALERARPDRLVDSVAGLGCALGLAG